MPRGNSDQVLLCYCAHRIKWFTDGACHNQADPLLRRAGIGAWLGQDHHANVSVPVRGPEQSNQIAELWAVVIVLHWAWAPTHIVTDSKWVMDGVLKLQAQPDTSVIKWEHHALWALVGGALRARHHHFFAMSWTRSCQAEAH